jgi:formylmethanofuran dehydrogenase subunit C
MIRLLLRQRPSTRLDLGGVIPERLIHLNEAEIARLSILQGGRKAPLADWFDVMKGGETAERLVIAGGGDRLDCLGSAMSRGEIVVEGDAGAYAGSGMTGGRLTIEGGAGHAAGLAMAGGELRIKGNAGDELAGARPGMRDGVLIVHGNAGSGAGDRLRRGTIVVGGTAGPFCGARMHAGTIVVGGMVGRYPGLCMRRGTIMALGGCASLASTFAEAGTHELTFARLIGRFLDTAGFAEMAERVGCLRRWIGDLAGAGRGEMLLPP